MKKILLLAALVFATAGSVEAKSLPANNEYCGVVVATKPADYPLVGIMDDGRVNDEAMPYQFANAAQRAAVKAALPNLIFEHD